MKIKYNTVTLYAFTNMGRGKRLRENCKKYIYVCVCGLFVKTNYKAFHSHSSFIFSISVEGVRLEKLRWGRHCVI